VISAWNSQARKKARGREEDRDISERIALGQVAQATGQEAQYDARLFNQSAGMDSGYHGGSDEKCALYDKPLFADRSQAGIYKFDKDRMDQHEGKFGHIQTKNFQGAAEPGGDDDEPRGRRNVPVEFEADDGQPSSSAPERGRQRSRSRRRAADDDDFGLDGLLEETKAQGSTEKTKKKR